MNALGHLCPITSLLICFVGSCLTLPPTPSPPGSGFVWAGVPRWTQHIPAWENCEVSAASLQLLGQPPPDDSCLLGCAVPEPVTGHVYLSRLPSREQGPLPSCHTKLAFPVEPLQHLAMLSAVTCSVVPVCGSEQLMLGQKRTVAPPAPALGPQGAARTSCSVVTPAAAGAGKGPRVWLGKWP